MPAVHESFWNSLNKLKSSCSQKFYKIQSKIGVLRIHCKTEL